MKGLNRCSFRYCCRKADRLLVNKNGTERLFCYYHAQLMLKNNYGKNWSVR